MLDFFIFVKYQWPFVKFTIKNISILLISFFLSFNSYSQCQVVSDFNDYSVNGMSTTIQWNLLSSSSVICSSSDWQPSFFVNSDSLLNVKITGEIYMSSSTNDDDFVGFVFGYKSPIGNAISNNNIYYLFDWRKNTQSAPSAYGGYIAEEGFNLTHARGVIEDNPVTTYQYFWGHAESEEFVSLDHLYGNSLGWEYNTNYHFELIYTSRAIIISIDGQEIFNVSGCYQPGLFGLYSFSQNGVRYKNIVYEQYYDIQLNDFDNYICEGVPVGFNFMDTSCSVVPSSLTSYEWNFGDGNYSEDLSPEHIYYSGGTNEVELYITDINYCEDTVRREIYIEPKAHIITQPEDVECFVGDNIVFSIEVENAEFYQWYYQADTMTTWTRLYNTFQYSGTSTNHLQLSNVRPEQDQMKFRCVMKGYCDNHLTSNFGRINVLDIPIRAELDVGDEELCLNDSNKLLLTLKELYLVESAQMRILFDTNAFEIIDYEVNLQDINFDLELNGGYITINYSVDEPINLIEAIIITFDIRAKGSTNETQFFTWDDENTYFFDLNGDTITEFLYNASVNLNKPVNSGINDSLILCYGEKVEIDHLLFSNILWSNGGTGSSIKIEDSGDYWVKLIDNNSCQSIDTFNVISLDLPQKPSEIIFDKDYYCTSDKEIVFSVEGGSGNYMQIKYNDGLIIDSVFNNQSFSIPIFNDSFDMNISWNNECGQSEELSKKVNIYPLVEPTLSIFMDDVNIELGEPVSLKAIATGEGDNPYFIWKVDDVVKQVGPDFKYVTSELKQDQNIDLSLYSNAKCILSGNYIEAFLKVDLNDKREYYIPKFVHLNGSSKNNTFKIVFRDSDISYFMLHIYDLAGRLVFSTKDPFEYWSGRNIKTGTFEMFTYRLMYRKGPEEINTKIKIVSGKFILKK